ncbi:MAG: hypothetical protein QXI58_08285 [Candidatus Micrarchaeia archaeon]
MKEKKAKMDVNSLMEIKKRGKRIKMPPLHHTYLQELSGSALSKTVPAKGRL